MKSSRSTNNKQSKQGISHKPKPEIRDDLDSRKKQEMIAKSNKEMKDEGGKRSHES